MTRLVYVGADDRSLRTVREVAREPDAITGAASELEALDLIRGGAQKQGLVLGPDLAEPVAVAQRLRRNGGDLALLFLCSDEDLDARRAEVLTAPFVGRHARCVTIGDRESLRSAINAMIAHSSKRRVATAIAESSNATITRLGEAPKLSTQVLLERLLETAPIGIAVLDQSRRIIAWNPACREITGLAQKKVMRKPLGDVLGSDWSQRVDELVRGSQPGETTGIFTRPDGLSLHLQCGLSAIEPQRPDSEQLCLLRDITARVQAQQQLLEAEKLASLGDVVAGIAHELNTPIGVCITAASILEEDMPKLQEHLAGDRPREPLAAWAREHQAAVDALNRNLKRTAALIKQFRHVTADHAAPGCQELNLRQKIDEILGSLRPLLQEQSVTLAVDCPENLTLWLDPSSLWQVITNLVSNAVKYAFPDDSAGNLRIAARAGTDTATLEVADDGAGISPAIRDRIFDPFVTTGRSQGGTGLGLHLVYQIVSRQWGGTIRVESEPGRGARFIMEFPRAGTGESAS